MAEWNGIARKRMQMTITEPVKSHDYLPQPGEEFFTSAAIETVFWRPRYIVDTPVMQHVPFLFWLVGAVRPRNVAVFGSGNGAALFAVCQALDKLNISAHCLGVGFWREGERGKIPAPLRDHANQIYDDIVRWRCETSVRQALNGIAQGSLDLLFIDVSDLPKDELPSAEEWLGLLHKDGVIVVHGELTSGNGWGGLLQSLPGKQAIITFPDEEGLIVLARGDDQPSRLRALLEVSDHGILPGEVGLFFRRLGQGHVAVAQQIKVSRENRKLISSVSAMRDERDEALNTGKELCEAFEARSRKLSELQTELFDCQNKLAQSEMQLEAAQREVSRSVAELQSVREAHSVEKSGLIAQLEEAKQQHTNAVEDAKAKGEAEKRTQLTGLSQELETARKTVDSIRAELERERKTRFEETAALVAQLEETKQQHASAVESAKAEAQAQLTGLSQELETARKARFAETAALATQLEVLRQENVAGASSVARLCREIQQLKDENASLSQRVEGLMNSTSWRITGPLRKAKTALSRN